MSSKFLAEKSEWPFLVSVEDIDSHPKTFTFEADETHLADLARRMGIVSVQSAKATVTVQQAGGGIIHAIGSASARITQNCVVTMAPVENIIEDEFEGWFGDKNSAVSFARARSEREAKKGHTEIEVLEESVDPEPIVKGRIDLGELATQYLCLSVDPYPRTQNAPTEYLAVAKGDKTDSGAGLRKNPFEALKDWKEKR